MLTAPQLTLEDGVAIGTGGTVLTIDGDVLTGERFALDLDTAVVVVTDGVWEREGEGTLTFAEAEVALDDLTGVILQGAFQGAEREVAISGETLVVVGPGELTGRKVSLTLCGCETGPQPWRVTARRVRVKLDDQVSFTGGWIRVFEVPVLPVPAGQLPLRRRSGLLPPDLGYGQDGFRAKLPIYLTLGRAADLTLTPSVRTGRSARLLTEWRYALRGGEGQLDVAGGVDWLGTDPPARFGGRWTHTHARGPWTSAVRAQLTSDDGYLADYGDAFLSRQTPWTEVRALGSWHGGEVWTDGFDGVEDGLHEAVGLGWRQGARELPGGVLVDGGAWGRLRTWGDRFYTPELLGWAADARLRVQRPTRLGPVMVLPTLEGRGLARSPWEDGDGLSAGAWGSAGVEARLLAWRASARSYERLEPYVGATVSPGVTAGTLDAWEAVPEPWQTRAGLRYRFSHRGGGLLELGGGAVLTEDGPYLELLGQSTAGVVQGWLQARSQPWGMEADTALGSVLALATAGVSVSTGPVTIGTTWWYAERSGLRQVDPDDPRDLHQSDVGASWALPGVLSGLTLGGGVRLNWTQGATLSNRLSLSYRSPCDCLTLSAATRIDQDRALPDVAFTIALE